MAIPNLVIKEVEQPMVEYARRELELVDRLNVAFPKDKDLHALLDLLLNRYADLVTCDCGRKAFIEVICNICDRDE